MGSGSGKRFDILRRSDGRVVASVGELTPLGEALVRAGRVGGSPALLGHGLVAWDRVTGAVIFRG